MSIRAGMARRLALFSLSFQGYLDGFANRAFASARFRRELRQPFHFRRRACDVHGKSATSHSGDSTAMNPPRATHFSLSEP